MTRATTSPARLDSVFAGSRSSISAAGTSPCRTRKNRCGWFSMGRSITSPSSGANWKGTATFFAPSRDTEVIIHGYKQWGDEVLNRLNGMFGLAHLGRAQAAAGPCSRSVRNQADLLQDRWGSPVFRLGDARRSRRRWQDEAEIDPTSLNLFLRYRYTPSPYTIIKGVRKLAPGTKLTVQDGASEVSRWYRFKPTPFAPPKSTGEATGGVTRHLQAGGEAAAHQRCAGRPALERRRRFRTPAGLDEAQRQLLADLHGRIRLDLRRR